jgi:hypothetical protein
MKRITLLHLVAIAFFAVGQAVADYNNLLFTFSTRGPDYYADGKTVVKDGEWYALVWSKEADTASFDEVILAAPLAKDGRCPYTFFQIDAADTARVKTTGYYSLRLLDTRDGAGNPAKPSADGRVPAVVAKANSNQVTASYQAGTTDRIADYEAVTSVDRWAWLSTAIAEIKSIHLVGDDVVLKIVNMNPAVDYSLAGGFSFSDATDGVLIDELDETLDRVKNEQEDPVEGVNLGFNKKHGRFFRLVKRPVATGDAK